MLIIIVHKLYHIQFLKFLHLFYTNCKSYDYQKEMATKQKLYTISNLTIIASFKFHFTFFKNFALNCNISLK